MTDVFAHPWLGGLFHDDAMAAIWGPKRQLEHYVAFEAAWSRALGQAGIVDAAIAEKAAQTIEAADIDVADLRAGSGRDGLAIPAFVQQLRTQAGSEAVHSGSTSQDVMDTGLVLTLRETSSLLTERLDQLRAALFDLEARFGDRALMGRTRMQAATPITVADRIETWRMPLDGHLERLARMKDTIERVQIGGASGDRAAMQGKGQALADAVAQTLQLRSTAKAWHVMRADLTDYANALALITGSLGKMGQDICLMAQQGLDEIKLGGGGTSSAMPHKQNPIAAELLVTLARFNAVQVSGMHQAMVHEQERSGSAWTLEWMILPQMAMATGRSLSAALDVCRKVEHMGAP